MRSFILTAAVAAVLASTPFIAGSAPSPGKGGAQTARSERAARGQAEKAARAVAAARDNPNGQGDPVPPVVIYPQGWMQAQSAYPATRLARIETEVGRAMHRINVDRRLGELTPREARVTRHEERAVRAEAVTIAREHHGTIPYPSYAMLQTRVAGLDRTIDHEASHA